MSEVKGVLQCCFCGCDIEVSNKTHNEVVKAINKDDFCGFACLKCSGRE
jgi:hypothetical protein